MLLRDVVTASAAVAAHPGRRDKVGEIARLLRRAPAGEVPVAVAYLSGALIQRQIGVGYAALIGLPGVVWDPGQPGSPGEDGEHVPPGPAGEAGPAGGDQGALTLAEVDRVFAEIGAAAGAGVQARRRMLLAELLGRASGAERGFLIRLIAGELGQGAGQGIMIEAVAEAAEVPAAEVRRAHQLGGSLPEVAQEALAEPGSAAAVAALRRFTLRAGRPAHPMLASPAPSLEAALARISPAAIEWKIDGIRVQIHREGPRVQVFTRTLDDITERVPEIVAGALSLDVASAVLDGEAVALRADGRPRPFQVTSARAASHRADRDGRPEPGQAAAMPLTVFLFDLLQVDGEDLIEVPAEARFRRLAGIVPAGLLIPRLVTGSLGEATAFFDGALRAGHEGVVVKSLAAPYRTGRRGSDWIKVKPRETLDLVILAAEWGHGRRTGLLSNLHLGARDPAGGGFVMLGKTFKGLTDAMLTWQTGRLLELADQPAGQAGDGGGPWPAPDRRHGVVRVRPELVAEIAFDGVQASSRYPGGVTLRFARVLRYRTDKSAADADTIETVRDLWQRSAQP